LPFTVTPAALLDALVALPERSPVPS
jgi:hypothetical protein